MRRPLLIASGLLAAAVLVSCSSPDPAPSPAPTASSATTAAPVPSPSETPSISPSTGGQVDPDAPAGQCADDAIGVDVVEADAGAGSIYYQVVFRNTGSTPCELRGFPGVSVVAGGQQVGASAEELTGGPDVETYTLPPDGTVGAQLSAVDVASGGGPLGDACTSTTGDAWRVYPPHSFVPIDVPAPGIAACAGADQSWLRIAPISAE